MLGMGIVSTFNPPKNVSFKTFQKRSWMKNCFYYFRKVSIIGNDINVTIFIVATTRCEVLVVFVQLCVLTCVDDFAGNRCTSRCVSPFHSAVLLLAREETTLKYLHRERERMPKGYLKPNLNLSVFQAESCSEFLAIRLCDVFLELELSFQSLSLKIAEHGPTPWPLSFDIRRAVWVLLNFRLARVGRLGDLLTVELRDVTIWWHLIDGG